MDILSSTDTAESASGGTGCNKIANEETLCHIRLFTILYYPFYKYVNQILSLLLGPESVRV